MTEELPAQFDILVPAENIEVRDAAKREVDVRLLPWNTAIDTVQGREMFTPGAFDGVDPSNIYLYAAEHEVRFGVGQDGRPKATRVPVGRASQIGTDGVGPVATFRVARTIAGDETLALLTDKIISGVSAEFVEVPGGTTVKRGPDGRRTRIHTRAMLTGATPSHRPAYGEQAAVLAVRSQQEGPMADVATPEPEQAPVPDIAALFAGVEARSAEFQRNILDKLEGLQEQARSAITIPPLAPEKPSVSAGDWAKIVIAGLSGDRIGPEQMRTIDDIVTSDNLGVVPPAYMSDLIGVIDPRRPFLQSTRRLATPSSGLKLIVPKITQRPEVGVQTAEKQELASRTTKIEPTDFDAVTVGGAADISLQLLKRSSPEFLTLFLQLLAEQMAIEEEVLATGSLLDAMGGVGAAGPLDPENLAFGAAFVNSFDAIKRGPDTLWLSTEALGEFIDAKASTTNQPMYGNITANLTVPGGISGSIQGLNVVHVPALDAHGAYAIVGPASGFAWAEDGSYTLQADVPSKAGRDVALVSMLWFAPWYPSAFTAYNVAS